MIMYCYIGVVLSQTVVSSKNYGFSSGSPSQQLQQETIYSSVYKQINHEPVELPRVIDDAIVKLISMHLRI